MGALPGASQSQFCVCRCIFFIHKQLTIRAVIADRCENACGQKRTLQNFHLDLRCILKQHEFIVLEQGKMASRRGCILFAHKRPMIGTFGNSVR